MNCASEPELICLVHLGKQTLHNESTLAMALHAWVVDQSFMYRLQPAKGPFAQ